MAFSNNGSRALKPAFSIAGAREPGKSMAGGSYTPKSLAAKSRRQTMAPAAHEQQEPLVVNMPTLPRHKGSPDKANRKNNFGSAVGLPAGTTAAVAAAGASGSSPRQQQQHATVGRKPLPGVAAAAAAAAVAAAPAGSGSGSTAHEGRKSVGGGECMRREGRGSRGVCGVSYTLSHAANTVAGATWAVSCCPLGLLPCAAHTSSKHRRLWTRGETMVHLTTTCALCTHMHYLIHAQQASSSPASRLRQPLVSWLHRVGALLVLLAGRQVACPSTPP